MQFWFSNSKGRGRPQKKPATKKVSDFKIILREALTDKHLSVVKRNSLLTITKRKYMSLYYHSVHQKLVSTQMTAPLKEFQINFLQKGKKKKHQWMWPNIFWKKYIYQRLHFQKQNIDVLVVRSWVLFIKLELSGENCYITVINQTREKTEAKQI